MQGGLLKLMLGGLDGVARFITTHEQAQSNEFAIFISLMWSLLSSDLTSQNVIIFTTADVVPCGSRKRLPIHLHSANYIFWTFGITRFI